MCERSSCLATAQAIAALSRSRTPPTTPTAATSGIKERRAGGTHEDPVFSGNSPEKLNSKVGEEAVPAERDNRPGLPRLMPVEIYPDRAFGCPWDSAPARKEPLVYGLGNSDAFTLQVRPRLHQLLQLREAI